jgi:hypothetical protein
MLILFGRRNPAEPLWNDGDGAIGCRISSSRSSRLSTGLQMQTARIDWLASALHRFASDDYKDLSQGLTANVERAFGWTRHTFRFPLAAD